MTDRQMQGLVAAIVAFLVTIATLFGASKVSPTPTPTPDSIGSLSVGASQPASRFKSLAVDNAVTVGGSISVAGTPVAWATP